MIFGLHITVAPENWHKITQLRKKGEITYPEGIKIIEEYVWNLKFLLILIETDSLENVMELSKQFSKHVKEIEIGVVTTLQNLTLVEPEFY
ncbi:MAG: DUF3303 family protein [Candidatus Hodarchaeales archaeon]